MSSPIPIVDLHEFNVTKDPKLVSEDVPRQLAAEVMDAFKTVGFISFRNYGIPQEKVCVVLYIAMLVQTRFIPHEGVNNIHLITWDAHKRFVAIVLFTCQL